MANFERVVLYASVVALALAVGWFGSRDRCPETGEPQGGAEELWVQVDEKLFEIKALLDTASERSELAAQMPRGELERIAPIIADSVYARLRQEGLCRPSAGPCETAPSISIAGDFTFLYDDARLNEDETITAESYGVRLASRHVQRLDRLVRAFRACQRDDAEDVKFKVTGYSSTAKFQVERPTGRTPHPDSDNLNLDTANKRAEVVAEHLRKAGFEVVPPQKWESFDALRRPYLDDSGPGDQQALNRSVFIEVVHAGACNLAKLPPPGR